MFFKTIGLSIFTFSTLISGMALKTKDGKFVMPGNSVGEPLQISDKVFSEWKYEVVGSSSGYNYIKYVADNGETFGTTANDEKIVISTTGNGDTYIFTALSVEENIIQIKHYMDDFCWTTNDALSRIEMQPCDLNKKEQGFTFTGIPGQ